MSLFDEAISSRKLITITLPTIQESTVSPVTLSTSEQATPNASYTVAASDLPTFNTALFKKIMIATVIAGGQFVTSGTIYWRMKKNGVSVGTSSFAVGTNYYYTFHAFFFDISVGDVLDVYLWPNIS